MRALCQCGVHDANVFIHLKHLVNNGVINSAHDILQCVLYVVVVGFEVSVSYSLTFCCRAAEMSDVSKMWGVLRLCVLRLQELGAVCGRWGSL